MLIFADTGETWTFQDVEVFSNRVANFFKYVALLQTFLCHYKIVPKSRASIFQLARIETRRYCGHLLDLAAHVYCYRDGAGKDRSDLELDQLQLGWRGETPVR